MPQRTNQEIASEIEALEACKKYVPRRTSFGEDNHAQLDLQIDELKIGIDDTCEEWWDWSERDRCAIYCARDWKDCRTSETPHSEWDAYKRAHERGEVA